MQNITNIDQFTIHRSEQEDRLNLLVFALRLTGQVPTRSIFFDHDNDPDYLSYRLNCALSPERAATIFLRAFPSWYLAVSSVEEIVELVSIKRPDVVVLDWMMADGGGPEAARRILQSSPEIRVVGLTSSSTSEAWDDMIDAGACGLLVKGGSGDDLAEMIRQASTPSMTWHVAARRANVNQLSRFGALDPGQSRVDSKVPKLQIEKPEPRRFWGDLTDS